METIPVFSLENNKTAVCTFTSGSGFRCLKKKYFMFCLVAIFFVGKEVYVSISSSVLSCAHTVHDIMYSKTKFLHASVFRFRPS